MKKKTNFETKLLYNPHATCFFIPMLSGVIFQVKKVSKSKTYRGDLSNLKNNIARKVHFIVQITVNLNLKKDQLFGHFFYMYIYS